MEWPRLKQTNIKPNTKEKGHRIFLDDDRPPLSPAHVFMRTVSVRRMRRPSVMLDGYGLVVVTLNSSIEESCVLEYNGKHRKRKIEKSYERSHKKNGT